jgi:hypothetical protein
MVMILSVFLSFVSALERKKIRRRTNDIPLLLGVGSQEINGYLIRKQAHACNVQINHHS